MLQYDERLFQEDLLFPTYQVIHKAHNDYGKSNELTNASGILFCSVKEI